MEIENKIKQLKQEILYEKRKMECCGYGKSDLMYLWQLESELKETEEEYDKGKIRNITVQRN